MRLFLILLSVMTWTVESKNAVQLTEESTVPYDIEAAYSNTYNKGQVRAGDVATLTLSHMGGITIEKVELAMRSNNGAGAGTVIVTADATEIAQKTVTWQSVSEAVEVFSGAQTNVQTLTISVGGSQNSLYVDAFTITWSTAAARKVTLLKGDSIVATMSEITGGAGIVLPTLENVDYWRFVGWSETEFWTVYEKPDYYMPGTRYVPSADCQLWATYQYAEATGEREFATDLVSGGYMYVHRSDHMALNGVPEGGKMTRAPEDIYDSNQHYWIEFAGTDTAYIEHIPTGQPIGYKGTEMATEFSPWLVYHQGDQTLFYTTIDGKNYVLWLNIQDKTNQAVTYAGLFQADPGPSPMGLQTTLMPTEIYAFTCHPETKVGIENVPDSERSNRKILRDGQVLILRQGETYTIKGLKLNVER